MEKPIQAIPVQNETRSQFTRFARDGKKITYKLKVIQQPERARACGSGAKCILSVLANIK